MGTWVAPQTAEDRRKLRESIKALKKLHKEVVKVFGDDIVEDAFMTLEDRLQYASKAKWGANG